MSPLDRLQIQADCEAVVLGFFYALDTFANDTAVEQFTETGVWNRQGTKLEGHAALRTAINARAPTRRTCHVIVNFRLLDVTVSTATAAFYLVAYEGNAGAAAGTPEAMRQHGIRDCRDSLVLTPKGWRIADKRSTAHLPMS